MYLLYTVFFLSKYLLQKHVHNIIFKWFTDPLPVEFAECLEQTGDSASKSNKKKNVVERLYQLPQVTPPDLWPPADAPKEEKDASGYSARTKLFYSGLLYCDMYDTMQAVERIYLQGDSIPEPREAVLKREQQSGFGASDMGTRSEHFSNDRDDHWKTFKYKV